MEFLLLKLKTIKGKNCSKKWLRYASNSAFLKFNATDSISTCKNFKQWTSNFLSPIDPFKNSLTFCSANDSISPYYVGWLFFKIEINIQNAAFADPLIFEESKLFAKLRAILNNSTFVQIFSCANNNELIITASLIHLIFEEVV